MPNEEATTHIVSFTGGPYDGDRVRVAALPRFVHVPERVEEGTPGAFPSVREGWLTDAVRYRDTIYYVRCVYELTDGPDGPRYVARPAD